MYIIQHVLCYEDEKENSKNIITEPFMECKSATTPKQLFKALEEFMFNSWKRYPSTSLKMLELWLKECHEDFENLTEDEPVHDESINVGYFKSKDPENKNEWIFECHEIELVRTWFPEEPKSECIFGTKTETDWNKLTEEEKRSFEFMTL